MSSLPVAPAAQGLITMVVEAPSPEKLGKGRELSFLLQQTSQPTLPNSSAVSRRSHTYVKDSVRVDGLWMWGVLECCGSQTKLSLGSLMFTRCHLS